MAQVNFWIPIYPITADKRPRLPPEVFDQRVKDGSLIYDYVEWNKSSRQEAAKHIQSDTRVQPKAEEDVELDPQIRPATPPGGIPSALTRPVKVHSWATPALFRIRPDAGPGRDRPDQHAVDVFAAKLVTHQPHRLHKMIDPNTACRSHRGRRPSGACPRATPGRVGTRSGGLDHWEQLPH